jgi:hypothetical protein
MCSTTVIVKSPSKKGQFYFLTQKKKKIPQISANIPSYIRYCLAVEFKRRKAFFNREYQEFRSLLVFLKSGQNFD